MISILKRQKNYSFCIKSGKKDSKDFAAFGVQRLERLAALVFGGEPGHVGYVTAGEYANRSGFHVAVTKADAK